MVSTSKIKPYAMYDSVYNLQMVDLYSGGETDPIVDATIYAQDNLAFDEKGNKLPFSLMVSLTPHLIDREKMFLEDMGRCNMRHHQKVVVTIIVWNDIQDYLFYESDDSAWAEIG